MSDSDQKNAPVPADVRMRGFRRKTPVADALRWLDDQLMPLGAETVQLEEAAGRILAVDVVSRVNVPGFARGMMDGFAVRADDTQGASPSSPRALQVVGEALPGREFPGQVLAGEAVRIMTGAPLPAGADAVLPVERVQRDERRIHAQDTVAAGKHVGRPGEDIDAGTTVLRRGRRLRPQDVGVLSSIGMARLEVVRRPRVRIVVTGSELLPAGSVPEGYRIADANSPMLHALARRDGALVFMRGILPDAPDAILEALREEADIVLVSGGSSVGQEDHAPRLLAEHGLLAVHGVAMRPGSPAGMGRLDQRLVFLLPGNPVACLCTYDFFAGRAVRGLGGRPLDWPYRRCRLPLRGELVSITGRLDYARVRIVERQVEPLAIRGASMLSSTCVADGFVVIPEESEGYAPGAEVEVFLYD